MNDIEELVEIIAETLLWELVSTEAEKVEYLPIMLQDINYLDDKETVISAATECEIFDTESFDIIEIDEASEKVRITYEMPCIISVWSDDKQLLRVTTMVAGTCILCGISDVDWDNLDFENMGHDELLSYKKFVEITELNFVQTECDDVRAYN